jgi:hypothetical protein
VINPVSLTTSKMPATKPLHVYEGTDSEDDNTPEQSVAKAPESKKYGSKSLANPMKTQHVAPQTGSLCSHPFPTTRLTKAIRKQINYC